MLYHIPCYIQCTNTEKFRVDIYTHGKQTDQLLYASGALPMHQGIISWQCNVLHFTLPSLCTFWVVSSSGVWGQLYHFGWAHAWMS